MILTEKSGMAGGWKTTFFRGGMWRVEDKRK